MCLRFVGRDQFELVGGSNKMSKGGIGERLEAGPRVGPVCRIESTLEMDKRVLLICESCTMSDISTTNLAACVCVSSKFDKFLPGRFYFVSKRPENFVRIAKFPYAAFGPLFAFHCPLFVTKNNNLGWNLHASPHTGTCWCNDHGPTVLSARGQ